MADFSATAANVIASSNATKGGGIAGVAITAGQCLYKADDGTLHLYKANGAGKVSVFEGIATNSAAAGQPVNYVKNDPSFTPGFAVAANAVGIGSGAADGNIAPVADLAAGWFLSILFVGIGSNKVNLNPFASGVAS